MGRTAVAVTAAVPGPPGSAGVPEPAGAHPRAQDAAIPAGVPLPPTRPTIAVPAGAAQRVARPAIRTTQVAPGTVPPFAFLAVPALWLRVPREDTSGDALLWFEASASSQLSNGSALSL